VINYSVSTVDEFSESEEAFFDASRKPLKPKELWTTSCGASGSRSPLAFLRALRQGMGISIDEGEEGYEPEECIGQDNIIDIPAGRIIQNVLIDKEQERHINLLSRQQLLFLKTETLYF